MDKSKAAAAVDIDEHQLGKECLRLPTQYLQAAFQSAEAKKDAAVAKNQLAVVEADLAKQMRSDPAGYGIEKVTESAVNAAVVTTSRYQKAKQAAIDADYNSDLASALVWAMEHKKKALTLAVDLHGMAYFSNPKVSEQGRDAVDRMERMRNRRRSDD